MQGQQQKEQHKTDNMGLVARDPRRVGGDLDKALQSGDFDPAPGGGIDACSKERCAWFGRR
jgi:hypothetical protein